MKTKLLLLSFCVSIMMYSTSINAQTTLVPGDLAVLQNQADTPDDFAFVTFVDIAAGTGIYFTDCGTTTAADGFRMPACTEGAVKYTVPAGGLAIGDIVKFQGGTNADFAAYNDSRITGGFGLATSGDQVVVFQDATNAAGGANAGNNPTYLFILHNSSTQFGGSPTDSNESELPFGLTDTGLPRTAVAVGAGPGVDVEWDNTVYSGTYTFNTVDDAKIALTDPANFVRVNALTEGAYPAAVTAIPSALTLTTLSLGEVELGNSVFVAPNPSNGTITIKNAGNVLQSAVITDLNGRLVSQLNLNGNTGDQEINLSNVLSSGMYFMTISTDSQSTIKKIIIQ